MIAACIRATVADRHDSCCGCVTQSGCIFLDRDGRHFHDILNFLRVTHPATTSSSGPCSTSSCMRPACCPARRQQPSCPAANVTGHRCRRAAVSQHHLTCMVSQDGSFSYPADGADYKYLLELRAEAEYYCLAALVEHIDRYPARARPTLPPAPPTRPHACLLTYMLCAAVPLHGCLDTATGCCH